MKKLIPLFYYVVILGLINCNDRSHSITDNKTNLTQPPAGSSVNTQLVAGGLYVLKNKDGSYTISKILVLDDFAVHLRTYSNRFERQPMLLSSDSLKILIGHAPLDRQGFLAENPILLKVEKVKESELEGYRIYLDEMNK